jgi:hypothetical protein
MSGHKVLIDTNVIIELEDHKEVSPVFAKFLMRRPRAAARLLPRVLPKNKIVSPDFGQVFDFIGSGRGTRTPDPRIMIPVL